MARATQLIVIDTEGRDYGKTYMIHEMPVRQSEWWGLRFMTILATSSIDMPPELVSAGLAGVAALGVRFLLGSIGKPEMKALHDEMFDSCITFIPDPSNPLEAAFMRGKDGKVPMVDSDIEEQQTLRKLREECLKLHLDFFPPAVRSILVMIAATASENISDALMSQDESLPSSATD